MNRCFPRTCRTTLTVSVLALAATSSLNLAQAQQGRRMFNDRVERGTLEITSPPMIRLNGKDARLAPGSRLFNEDNRIVMANAYRGSKFTVHYLLDNMGQVGDVWILTKQEITNTSAGEQQRMKAAAAGAAVKYNGPVFQPGKPYGEQHQYRNPY